MQRRIDQAAPAFAHAHHFQAVLLATADHRADHRVEPRAVASSGQDRDFHVYASGSALSVEG